MAAIQNKLTDNDLNGKCFIREGEVEKQVDADVVLFAPNRPRAWIDGEPLSRVPIEFRDLCILWLNNCLIANIEEMVSAAQPLQETVIARIAYYRILTISEGHVFANDAPELHNCRDSFRRQLPDDWVAPAIDSPTDRVVRQLEEMDKDNFRKMYLNAVCTVAYVFRIRAHRWTENIDTEYRKTWKKVMAPDNAETPLLDWKYFARNAIHAIYPDTLDHIWAEAFRTGKCKRQLALRFHCACAGTEGIKALRAGLEDLKGAMPKLVELIRPHEQALIEIEAQIEGKRWAGSVNHYFYGQPGIYIEENKLGPAASFVLHAFKVLAPSAPLADSPVLKRIARTAPMTGAMLAIAGKTIFSIEPPASKGTRCKKN